MKSSKNSPRCIFTKAPTFHWGFGDTIVSEAAPNNQKNSCDTPFPNPWASTIANDFITGFPGFRANAWPKTAEVRPHLPAGCSFAIKISCEHPKTQPVQKTQKSNWTCSSLPKKKRNKLLSSLKLTANAPENLGIPTRKGIIPTIHFQRGKLAGFVSGKIITKTFRYLKWRYWTL